MEKEDPNNSIKIVCPSAEELSVIVNNVRCEECGLSFHNEPRLRMHVLKIHERKKLEKTTKENIRYHCPELSCVYSPKSQRYFTTMKYVKQHYLKVHAAKTFGCTLCDKSFSTDAARQAHSRVCGIEFTCNCLRMFGTYEALLTHGKRMGHSIDEKYKSTLIRKVHAKTPPVVHQRGNRPISILPQSANLGRDRTVNSTAKISLDVAVQTDDIKRHKRTPSPSKTWKRRESRQTQTSVLSNKEKRQRKTVETQTNEAAKGLTRKLIKKSGLLKNASSFVKDLAFTENYGNEHLFPGSPLQLQHDVRLQDFWEEKNTSLGTQTSPEKDLLEALNESVTEQQTELSSFYDRQEPSGCLELASKNSAGCLTSLTYGVDSSAVESGYPFNTADSISRSDPMLTVQTFPDRFSSIETQTETAYSDTGYSFDSEVALSRSFAVSSNTETQTTENFDNMEQLLYSNTCTQTCNDILPSDLGLSDIQTQTAWPELEDGTVAAETQTCAPGTSTSSRSIACMSSCRSWLNTRTIHTETQTELLSMFDEFQ